MDNHTFFITTADTGPTTQKSHVDRNDVASCEGVSILDQYECIYKVVLSSDAPHA